MPDQPASDQSTPTPSPRGIAHNEQQFAYIFGQICNRLHGPMTRQILHDLVVPQLSVAYPVDATIMRVQARELYLALTTQLDVVVLGVINGQLDREGIHPLTPQEIAHSIKAATTRASS